MLMVTTKRMTIVMHWKMKFVSIVFQRTNGGMEKKQSNIGLTGNDNKTRKMDLCMVLINIESIL